MRLLRETCARVDQATGLSLPELRHSRALIWSAIEPLDRALASDIATPSCSRHEIVHIRAKLETVLLMIANIIEGHQ
jgi:hypothetical protein